MAGKIDGIGESGFVPFLIKLNRPDSELAGGKTEYSTSDSLLSSFRVVGNKSFNQKLRNTEMFKVEII